MKLDTSKVIYGQMSMQELYEQTKREMNKIYTNEEFKEMVEFLQTITTHIPEHQAGYVWNNYKKISGDHSNQPCMCGSAAAHWRRAIETMREYVKTNSDKYND